MNQSVGRIAGSLLVTILLGSLLGFLVGAAFGFPSDPFWLWGGFVFGMIGATAFGAGFLTAVSARLVVWRNRAGHELLDRVLSVIASGLGSAFVSALLLLELRVLFVLPLTAFYGLAAAATTWVLARRQSVRQSDLVTAAAESAL